MSDDLMLDRFGARVQELIANAAGSLSAADQLERITCQ